MKNSNGYRPWVARKAPLFNSALNATYIKVSALFPIVIVSLCVGAATGVATQSSLPNLDLEILTKTKTVAKSSTADLQAKANQKPIETATSQAPIQEIIVAPVVPEYSKLMVPEIPLHNTQVSTIQNTSNINNGN